MWVVYVANVLELQILEENLVKTFAPPLSATMLVRIVTGT